MTDIDLDDSLSYSVVLWTGGPNGYKWGPPNTDHRTRFPDPLCWLDPERRAR